MNLAKIAQIANVSKSAVSIALNGKPGVSEVTRAEILRIARETGYVQRARPRADKAKTIRILAVVEGNIVSADFSRSPFFVELVARIQKATELAGYACVVSMVPLQDANAELTRIEAALPSAGLLLLGTNLNSGQVTELCRHGTASVVVDTLDELLPVNMVVMNNRQGALLAAEHLMRLGHRHIGFGRCETRIANFQMREQGFIRGLANHGLVVAPHSVFPLPSSIEGSQAAFARYLEERRGDLPTAIFCENDYMAIGVVRALAGAGLSVPGDVSVVGFDDIGEASVVTPELTTVHVAKDQIARFAVERLLAIMQGETGTSIKQIVDVDLVIRQSTAAV
jgi:DNA-binding LacI/PurR family transcriptional regulator